MAAVAVGNHIQQAGAFLLLQKGLLAAEGINNSQRIVAVHALCVPGLWIESGAQTGREGVTHGFTAGLSAHGVLVVHHVDEHRQAALHVSLPEGLELVHAGEGHAFQHRAAGHGAISQVGHHDTLLAVHLLIEGRTHGNGAGAAHNSIVRINAEGREESMHGAAQALVEARGTGKNLCHGTIEQEPDTQFLGASLEVLSGHGYRSAAPELLHHLLEFRLRQNLDRTQALGQNLTVGTVAAEDEIVGIQGIGHTHSRSLLTGRKVRRTRVIVSNPVVAARSLDQVEHGLELADDEHIAVDVLEVFLGKVTLRQFVLDRLGVFHHRDLGELNLMLLGAEHLIGINI